VGLQRPQFGLVSLGPSTSDDNRFLSTIGMSQTRGRSYWRLEIRIPWLSSGFQQVMPHLLLFPQRRRLPMSRLLRRFRLVRKRTQELNWRLLWKPFVLV
jgi:hypothetical protein